MGTTDPALARTATQVLRDARVPFALLHGRARLLEGLVSDVDLVVDELPETIIRRTRGAFAEVDLFPVVVTEYDLGGTRGVWYCTADGCDGVQLDFLYDLEGLGRQGLRSQGLMSLATETDSPIPVVSYSAELVYLWRKRVWKRQGDRLEELRRASTRADPIELRQASMLITGSDRTATELGANNQRRPHWLHTASHPLLRAARLARRVLNPAGYWVHMPSEGLARAISARFGRFLPYAASGQAPGSGGPAFIWFTVHVQPVRLRPGLFVSYGYLPGGLRPDLSLLDSSVSHASAQVVEAMTSRFGS